MVAAIMHKRDTEEEADRSMCRGELSEDLEKGAFQILSAL